MAVAIDAQASASADQGRQDVVKPGEGRVAAKMKMQPAAAKAR
jgi:hypothetical protein